jgi:hypothetical protein
MGTNEGNGVALCLDMRDLDTFMSMMDSSATGEAMAAEFAVASALYTKEAILSPA